MVMAMQLPDKAPLAENVVITSPEELKKLVSDALSRGYGAFLKVFSKDSGGNYYITLLFDRSKILAAECLLVDRKETLTGAGAVEKFKSLLSRPMVVDAYALDEIETKMSVAENHDVYSETPKTPLEELLGGTVKTVKEEKQEITSEIAKAQPASQKPAVESKPAPKPVEKPVERPREESGKPEVIVNFTGGTLPEMAFQKYAENIIKEAQRIKGLRIKRIEFDANVG
jgi:hypothetical protein